MRTVLRTMHQLVYQAYIQEVFRLRRPELLGIGQLPREVQDGLRGLSYRHVWQALNPTTNKVEGGPIIVPRIMCTRPRPRNEGKAHFAKYPYTWAGRLQALFDWDDDTRRGWHNSPFRQRAREYYSLILEETGEITARRWKEDLGRYATRFLWIIPQYDKEKLSVKYKASKCHTSDTRESIKALPEGARLNWITCQLDKDRIGPFYRTIQKEWPPCDELDHRWDQAQVEADEGTEEGLPCYDNRAGGNEGNGSRGRRVGLDRDSREVGKVIAAMLQPNSYRLIERQDELPFWGEGRGLGQRGKKQQVGCTTPVWPLTRQHHMQLAEEHWQIVKEGIEGQDGLEEEGESDKTVDGSSNCDSSGETSDGGDSNSNRDE